MATKKPMGMASVVTTDEKIDALRADIEQLKTAVNELSMHLFRRKAV